jgi:hypothetical protein
LVGFVIETTSAFNRFQTWWLRKQIKRSFKRF